MSIIQDDFNDTGNLSELLGSEVVSGELVQQDFDGGIVGSFNGSSFYGIATGYKGVTGTSARTVHITFRSLGTSATAGDNTLISFGANTNGARYTLHLESGVIFLRMVLNVISFGTRLNDGQWHSITIVNTSSPTVSSGFSCYVDGSLVAYSIVANGGHTINISSTADVTIGALNLTSTPSISSYFPGHIDIVRLYNTALSADDIFALSRANIEPPTANLQAYWSFNEGSGTSVTDLSGNSRTLTLSSSSIWSSGGKSYYTTKNQTTSNEITNNVTSVDFLVGTNSRRSGGQVGAFQFSNDNSIWKAPSGETVSGYGSYDFDGINDYIDLGSNSSIDDIFGAGGTIMFWVYIRDGEENQHIFSKGNSTNANMTRVLMFGTFLGFIRSFTTTDGVWNTKYNIPKNKWLHVAIVYDGTNAGSGTPIFYINGIAHTISNGLLLAFTSPVGFPTSDASFNMYLGTRALTNRYLNGKIADFRIYKGSMLTASTVYDYYSKGIEPVSTLSAHYKMNGNANDETGTNNGTVSGAVNSTTWYNIPLLGYKELDDTKTLFFDGVNDTITIPDDASLSFGNSSTDVPFSLAAWVKFTEYGEVISKTLNTSTMEWEMHIGAAGFLSFRLYDDNTSNYIGRSTTTAFDAFFDKWTYICATYDGSSSANGIRIYINGIRSDNANFNLGTYTALSDTTAPVDIGFSRYDSSYGHGYIANVAIWFDVRTQDEIIADTERGYIDASDAHLLALWPLNDGNSTAINLQGNTALNGTISGPTLVNDISRPPTGPFLPQNIDLSTLGLTNVYYRYLTEGNSNALINALDSVDVEYTEAGTGVVKTLSLPLELVKYVDSRKKVYIEQLAELSQRLGIPLESLKSLVLSKSTVIAAITFFSANTQLPIELLTAINKDNGLVIEFLLTLANLHKNNIESTSIYEMDSEIPVNIVSEISDNYLANIEHTLAVTSNSNLLLEIIGKQLLTNVLLIDFVSRITKDQVLNVETLQTLSRNKDLLIEFTGILAIVYNIPVEIFVDATVSELFYWCLASRSTEWTLASRTKQWSLANRSTSWTLINSNSGCS
jgi:hypothetical protein